MIAIIPNPSDAIVELYTTDRNKYIIQFVRDSDNVQINMFVKGQNDTNENMFITGENVHLEHAQNFWKYLVQNDVPYPEALRNYTVKNDRRVSKSALFASVILSLGIGFSLGFLTLDRSWLQNIVGAGTVTTGQDTSGSVPGESGRPSGPTMGSKEGSSTPSPSAVVVPASPARHRW